MVSGRVCVFFLHPRAARALPGTKEAPLSFPSCLTVTGTLARAGVVLAAFCGVAPALAHFPPPTTPATVFYGALTPTEQAEVQAWGVAYWTKVEGGTPSAMTFSNPAMNSHLFNPFRGTRATLENLKLLDAGDCDRSIIEGDTSTMDAATLAKRQSLKDAMCAAKFATDPVTNPEGTVAHAAQILDAVSTSQLVTYSEGGKLVSEKLPLDILVAAGADPQLAANLSTDTINAINAIVVAAPGYAQAATGGTEAQKLLNGGASRTDQAEARLITLLQDLDLTGSFTVRYEAAFGVYGSLPVIAFVLPDAFILVDGVTGAVAGPYKPDTNVDAGTLLAVHSEYSTSFGAAIFTMAGCRQPASPPKNIPSHPTTPALPWAPQPPLPGKTPGNPTTWACGDVMLTAGASCCCTRTITYIDTTSTAVPPPTKSVLQRCCLGGACPGTSVPTSPLPGSNCTYFY